MELVSLGAVAEIFGVTTQTVRNWSREGKLEACRTVGHGSKPGNTFFAQRTVLYDAS